MTLGIVTFIAMTAGSGLMLRLAHKRESKAQGSRFTSFLLRRLAWTFLTVLLVFTASFFLMRSVPGGPFDDDRGLDAAVRENLEAHFGLDRSLVEQYFSTLGGIPTFDLGPSMKLRDFTVTEIMAQGLPPSILLGLAALLWTLALGIPIGIVAALRRGTGWDSSLTALASLGMAIPNFVLAGLLMIPLVFLWQWLPAAGLKKPLDLLLPSFCLGAPFAAQVARLMRTGMLDMLDQDWVRTAKAKGLSSWTVLTRHALRGALPPVVTFLGPAIAGILTGSLVIEQVFAIPGIGTHFVQSAINRDYTLSMGMIILYTLLVAVMNIIADLLHALLDPRVKPS